MKLTIGKKIGSGFGVMLIMMLVLGSSSFYFLSTIKDQFTTINEAHDRQELGLKILDEFGTGIAAIRGFVAYGDEKFMQQVGQAMKNTIEMENQIMAMAREEKKKDAVQLIEMTTKYRDGLVNDLAPVVRVFHQELRAGNITRALELEQRSKEIAYGLIPITEEINALLQNVSDENGAIVVSSFEQAFDDANAVQGLSLTIALVALIVGLLLSIVLTRMFRNPILALVGDANQMAAGDLSQAMEVRSADEVGELGQALRTMQANFRDMIQQIKKSTDLLRSSSEQLSAGAEQAALATNQVVEAISSVAGGTEKQLDAVGQTATVVSEISAAIDLVVADAQRAEGAVQRTTGAAREGGEAVTAAIKQMGNIEATTLQTVEVVAKLGEHSKEIGLIVDTISGIASQTNLLALNAAIEAARAGESGRGFAVVAEEVRKLAEQSQEAAHQIAALISEVQGETDKAVAAMNSGAEEVKAGTEVVNKAGGSFTAITRMVDDVSREVQHIAEVIQQVAEGANRIVVAVDAIETVSKDTTGQAQTVSAATEEQSATMEEITASSQSLAQMAGELQTIVNKFIV